jgi:hypothetical protein
VEGQDAWEFRQADAQGVTSTAAIAFTREAVPDYACYAYFDYLPEEVGYEGGYENSYYDYSAVNDVSVSCDTWTL